MKCCIWKLIVYTMVAKMGFHRMLSSFQNGVQVRGTACLNFACAARESDVFVRQIGKITGCGQIDHNIYFKSVQGASVDRQEA